MEAFARQRLSSAEGQEAAEWGLRLAHSLSRLGFTEAAIQQGREAVQVAEVAMNGNAELYVRSLLQLQRLEIEGGQFPNAVATCQRALAAAESRPMSTRGEWTLWARDCLAEAYLATGDGDKAAETIEATLLSCDSEDPDYGSRLLDFARALFTANRLEEARARARQAVTLLDETPEDHIETEALLQKAEALLQQIEASCEAAHVPSSDQDDSDK